MRQGVGEEAQAGDTLLQPQRSLARFGQFALQSDDLEAILHTACRLVGDALGTDLAKVMSLCEDGATLLVRAGVGWEPGVVGEITVEATERGSEGHALRTGEPVISDDIGSDTRYTFAPFLRAHGVVSLANVAIPRSAGRPFGVLQVDSRSPRHFTEQHVSFLHAYANLIGAAVERLDTVAANRRQRRALEASEQRSRLALEVGRLASWDWDLVTDAVSWSDEHYRMQGYAIGEVQPSYEAWARRVHPEDLAGTIAALAAARDTHTDYVHDFRNLLPDGTVRWLSARGRFFYDDHGRPLRMIGMMQDISEQHVWAETQRTLVAELQHRTRNLLALVRSIASQTMRRAASMDRFSGLFNERLAALSRVQGLLSHAESEPITIRTIVEMELEALGPIDRASGRIAYGGPDILLRNGMVQPLALAFHELATNARKYGALADGDGRLRVDWERRETADGLRLIVVWTETGIDAPVAEQGGIGTGFGRSLIEKALPYQLGGETEYRLSRDRLHCTMSIPLLKPREAIAP
jgi:PAS domain S-box-containing protein